MEIIIQTFLVFTGLMFWVMYYSKKGLLAEIKKTEKKISEKIIVLEDLLDSVQNKSLLMSKDSMIDDELISKQNKTPNAEFKIKPLKSPTELRVLSLKDSKSFEFIDTSLMNPSDEIQQDESKEQVSAQAIDQNFDQIINDYALVDSYIDNESTENPDKDESHIGVTQIILEAKDNLKKIEVTDNIKIKSFKDVVLISKMIETQKR